MWCFFLWNTTAAFWLWICLTGKQKSAEEDNQILRSSFESWGFLAEIDFDCHLSHLSHLGGRDLRSKRQLLGLEIGANSFFCICKDDTTLSKTTEIEESCIGDRNTLKPPSLQLLLKKIQPAYRLGLIQMTVLNADILKLGRFRLDVFVELLRWFGFSMVSWWWACL